MPKERADRAWFSRLLWHLARKWCASILSTPEPAWSHHVSHSTWPLWVKKCTTEPYKKCQRLLTSWLAHCICAWTSPGSLVPCVLAVDTRLPPQPHPRWWCPYPTHRGNVSVPFYENTASGDLIYEISRCRNNVHHSNSNNVSNSYSNNSSGLV